MVKKVLPPLNEQNQVPNIATSGEWKAEDATFLEKLAKGLKMGGEEIVSATDIVSVPDVWARVLIVRLLTLILMVSVSVLVPSVTVTVSE